MSTAEQEMAEDEYWREADWRRETDRYRLLLNRCRSLRELLSAVV
jgi:hypothetical protein